MNFFKTAFLLTALTVLLLFVGQAFAGQQGLTIALIVAVLMNGFAYFFSDKIALKMSRARPTTREQSPLLYEITERLCRRANLPMPRLYIIPQQAPNAFATGRNPKNAAVAVTHGLMELMTEEEIEGVIAHELAHVRNYDILIASVAATIAGAITWIAMIGRWAMMLGGRDNRNPVGLVGGLLMLILAPIAAALIQMAISRRREYAADAAAARMVGHPYGLIKALEKLGAYNQRIPMEVSPATSSLFIVAPLGVGKAMMNLFSTHPPLEKRIEALRGISSLHR
jgi:heat shock protein HtpX